ncbi:unnamed protein product [Spirodela intermedia]|uniref:Transcription factor MYB1 n=1 Tax=Spirodela intermedia TaxID=51605 RepID=A0A7I8ILQ9_SPIIN|nr:unnamed protein product [Spirodela intermedia]CAA6658676.1 unnamed protein product [Spirodela intermedia]
MGRRPCCAKEGLNRGAWSSAEDKILVDYINAHGEGKWRDLPRRAGLKRCGKSCRLRWLNYLRPDIKRGNISKEEEDLIIRLHKLLGNRWSLIAGRLPGRTDNEIKNYWNTNLSKKVSGDSSPSDWRRPHCRPRDKKTAAREMDLSQEVIRTKAARCTRIFFPAPPAQEAAAHQTEESGCRETAFPKRDDYLGILHDFDIDELMSNTEELDFLRVSEEIATSIAQSTAETAMSARRLALVAFSSSRKLFWRTGESVFSPLPPQISQPPWPLA